MDVLHFGPAELIRTLTGRERAGQGTRMVNSRVIGGGGGAGGGHGVCPPGRLFLKEPSSVCTPRRTEVPTRRATESAGGVGRQEEL